MGSTPPQPRMPLGSRSRRLLPWRVFLSHTSDLREHPADRSFVAAAEAAVMRAGHAVTDMAYFVARDTEPADYCMRMVESADVYVGIIGLRYGALVGADPGMSYTELEFETATALGLPRLIFLVREGASTHVPAGQPHEERDRQEAFRRRLQEAGVTVAWIDSPVGLEIGLHQSLVDLRTSLGTRLPSGRRTTRRTSNPPAARSSDPVHASSHDATSPLVAFWARMDQPELGAAISLLRERFGFTRSQLIQRMCDLCEEDDLGLDESLVYRWEKGERDRPRPRPGARYRRLLGRVCDREVEHLNAIDRREFLRRLVALAAPPVVLSLTGAEQPTIMPRVAGLSEHQWTPAPMPVGLTEADVRELTNQYERLRRRVSGAHLIGPVRAHIDFVARYLRDSSLATSTRTALMSAMGDAAVLAGRLAFWDVHDEAGARQYFAMAGEAAREAEDRPLGAYALAFSAELATYVKQPEQAVMLSRSAQELAAGTASPRVLSWLAAVEAEAAAHTDDAEGCVRALAQAREAMDRSTPDDHDPQWIEFFDQSRLAGYAGACLVRIGHADALPVLRRAATYTDPALKRYQAEIAADTAWALAQQGEIEESCRLLEGAFDFARAVDYRDGLRRVFRVRQEMVNFGDASAVRALDERLRLGWVG